MGPTPWLGGQNFWLPTIRPRVRFTVLPWEFSLAGEDRHSGHDLGSLQNLGLKPLLRPHAHTYQHHSHHRGNVTAPYGRPNLRRRLHFGHNQEGRPRSLYGHVVVLGGKKFIHVFVNCIWRNNYVSTVMNAVYCSVPDSICDYWTYVITIWGTASNWNIEILQRYQNNVFPTTANAPRYISNTVLHTDWKVPTVTEGITKFTVKYTDKITTHPNELTSTLLDKE
jgi:hypothetical protein